MTRGELRTFKGTNKRGNKIINTGQVNGINGDESRTGNKPNKGRQETPREHTRDNL